MWKSRVKIGIMKSTMKWQKTFLRINTYNDEAFFFFKKLIITIIESGLCGKWKAQQ